MKRPRYHNDDSIFDDPDDYPLCDSPGCYNNSVKKIDGVEYCARHLKNLEQTNEEG